MSSSNPVSSSLANEKLTGENYMKWKSNLNIVLICEKPKKSSKSKENKNTKTSKRKTPKGTCFHCRENGHLKINCPKYLADLKEKKKGKFDLLVLEACFVTPWVAKTVTLIIYKDEGLANQDIQLKTCHLTSLMN